ncbi:MAG: ABC transporter permease [Bacteroidales bacterium]|nr:ABC transporter permease [Bacteroidales bacterium]
MFLIYIKIALRILFKDRIFSLINICGLAIGMACFILIALYVKYEWDYDKFYPNSDRIYRVNTLGGITNVEDSTAKSPMTMSEYIMNDCSDLVEASGFVFEIWGAIIQSKQHTDYEYNMFYAPSDFFSVFEVKPIIGNLDSALDEANTVVITAAMALKYFPDQDPIGKQLKIDFMDSACTVTAVIEDLPQNSHIRFDFLISYQTIEQYITEQYALYSIAYTYVKLKNGVLPAALNNRFPNILKRYVSPVMQKEFNTNIEEYWAKNRYEFYIAPLHSLHLFSEVANNPYGTSNIKYFYLFGGAGILILVLTILNYIKLSIARSITRIKSISLRKASGAGNWQLLFQFLVESLVMSFFAILLALSIFEFVIPFFENLIEKPFGAVLSSNPFIYVYIIIGGLLLGLIAGIYPAKNLSSVTIAKNISNSSLFSRKRGLVRKLFVGLQFVISFVIIISSVVVYSQLKYIFNADIALEKEKIIVLSSAYVLGKNKEAFKKELLQNENIEAVSFSNIYPGPDYFFSELKVYHADTFSICTFSTLTGDFDLDKIFGFNLIQGRMPEDTIEGDSIAVVINETAVKKYGFTDPLNCSIEIPYMDSDTIKVKVVGVVSDFHYESLHKDIGPLLVGKIPTISTRFFLIKTRNTELEKTMDFVHNIWNKHTDNSYFQGRTMEYSWQDMYKEEKRTSDLLLFFSIITVIIACIGLIGIVTYTSNSRIREIGIRKAIGASDVTIIMMLLKEHVLLLIGAIFIAIPLAYTTVYSWLGSFAYRIELSSAYFILPSVLLSLVVVCTVIYVARKAIKVCKCTKKMDFNGVY